MKGSNELLREYWSIPWHSQRRVWAGSQVSLAHLTWAPGSVGWPPGSGSWVCMACSGLYWSWRSQLFHFLLLVWLMLMYCKLFDISGSCWCRHSWWPGPGCWGQDLRRMFPVLPSVFCSWRWSQWRRSSLVKF